MQALRAQNIRPEEKQPTVWRASKGRDGKGGPEERGQDQQGTEPASRHEIREELNGNAFCKAHRLSRNRSPGFGSQHGHHGRPAC